jgi:uroporphyrinogen III methyltransferase/synthase
MQSNIITTTGLAGRTILVSPDTPHTELANELQRHGARVLTWPGLDISHLEDYAALDETIENLFGYDWLIFRNVNAVDFFLRRFQELGHDISGMDSLRVCAIGEATNARLEEFQVHVDVIPGRLSSAATFSAIESYVGGRDSVGGLNFLIPRAAIGRDSLTLTLEDAGARVDEVTTYRTSAPDNPDLAQIKGLLNGGGIDCIAFAAPSEMREFAAVFDANDLAPLLKDIVVACADDSTTRTAADFDVGVDTMSTESTSLALACAVSEYFGTTGQ